MWIFNEIFIFFIFPHFNDGIIYSIVNRFINWWANQKRFYFTPFQTCFFSKFVTLVWVVKLYYFISVLFHIWPSFVAIYFNYNFGMLLLLFITGAVALDVKRHILEYFPRSFWYSRGCGLNGYFARCILSTWWCTFSVVLWGEVLMGVSLFFWGEYFDDMVIVAVFLLEAGTGSEVWLVVSLLGASFSLGGGIVSCCSSRHYLGLANPFVTAPWQNA